jgi:uncharacterized protein
MIVVISPAKTLDFEAKVSTSKKSTPVFNKEANILSSVLKTFSQKELANLFHVNPKLAELNYNRYQVWKKRPNESVLKQAAFAFKGDVYQGLKVEELNEAEIEVAQKHLRILSGLYGVLKPLDLIQPYRLEMGTSLQNEQGKNLYDFC